MKKLISSRRIRFLEFFTVGVVMGLVEDIIAVHFATGEKITPKVILIILPIAVIFALISEYLVDHPHFWEKLLNVKEKNSSK